MAEKKKTALTPATFRQTIETGEIPGCCLFLGENSFEKHELLKSIIETTVDPATKAFNYESFQASEASPEALANAVNSAPMLAKSRTVVVKDIDSAKESVLEILASPPPSTRLLLTAVKLDGRKKSSQAISAIACVVKCDIPYENHLPEWIAKRSQTLGKHLTRDAAMHLVENVGRDVARLASELDKLFLYVDQASDITLSDVESVTGIVRQDTIFELMDSLGAGKTASALAIAGRMVIAGNHPTYLVSRMASHLYTLLAASDQLRREGLSGLANTLGSSRQFLVKKYQAQITALGRRRIYEGMRLALKTESDLKRGYNRPEVALDALILALGQHPSPLTTIRKTV